MLTLDTILLSEGLMSEYRYETHKMPDPLLPFIYHRQFVVETHAKYPNWHENIELLQILEGRGYVRCGTESLPVQAGEVFVVNADVLHSIGTETRLVYRCLIVDNSFFLSNGIPVQTLHFQSVLRDGGIYALFDRIVEAYRDRSEDFRSVLAIRAGVLQLLQALCDHCVTRTGTPDANEHIKKAMTYIRQNLSRPMSLDDIAARVGISKFHLARRFKLFTGKTVVQTVNLMRCTEAQRLLEDGMSVSAAAASCGYENLSYFTRTFKALMGRLPSEVQPRKPL